MNNGPELGSVAWPVAMPPKACAIQNSAPSKPPTIQSTPSTSWQNRLVGHGGRTPAGTGIAIVFSHGLISIIGHRLELVVLRAVESHRKSFRLKGF